MGNCASDGEGTEKERTDRGGWTEGVRFLEASGGPGSLVPTLTASTHRQCAPRPEGRGEDSVGGGRGVLLRGGSYRKAEAAGT